MDGQEAEMSRQQSFKLKKNVLEKEGEREATHKKAFTKWVNSKLSQRSPPTQISNLITDLQDGKVLLNLLEVLTDRKLKKEKGNLRVHKINNVERALLVLGECKVKLVGINGFDIVDGKPRVILGLLWSIILRFQVQEVMKEGSDASNKSSAVEKLLLDWCKERLQGYDVKITDFSVSWRDGYAFNALLHSYRPDAFDYSALSHMEERKRLDHAFNQGEKTFAIPRILDSSDVYVERPDKKLIILCLSNLYDYLEGTKSKIDAQKVNEEQVVIEVDHEVESSLPPTWDELDAGSTRSAAECAKAQEETTRKLDDLEAAIDDAEFRKPTSTDSNLVDLEDCKRQLDKHEKYTRTIDSLDQCKQEVFTEIDQTLNDGLCDKDKVDHYNDRMKTIDIRIKGLRETALAEQDKISLAYTIFLNQNLKKLEDAVTTAEKKIKTTKDVASDYEAINEQLEEHRKFQEEVGDHSLVNIVLDVDVSNPAVDNDTRRKVRTLSKRWKSVWDWSEDRKKKLMNSSSEWQKFRDQELELLNWLAVKEKALKEISKTDLLDEKEVKRVEKQLEEIQKDLDDQEERLDSVHDCGQKLIQDANEDKEAVKEIEKQLKDFDGCWNDIASQVIEGKEKLRNASNKIREIQAEMKEVNEWMDEATNLIDNIADDLPQEDQDKIKDKIELKCEERPQTLVRVQRTHRLANDVTPLMSPESSKKLEKDVEVFNEKWRDTNAALEGFSDKGYSDAKTDCCLMRIIKRKFKSTNN